MPKQQTITEDVEFSGVGLHSGRESHIVFRPAPADHGIVFRRTDVDGQPEIPARVQQVSEVKRGTVLASDGAHVRTVEHVLAAVSALQIDNLLIDIDGDEPPAVDGSAAPFARGLDEAGVESQAGDAPTWACGEPFVVEEGESRYAVLPSASLMISSSIEYEHPLIRRQHASYRIQPAAFCEDIAPARTFGFLRDAEPLRAAGLAQGASIENTVVLTDDGLYEGIELRYEDEFVRHKIVDLVGDLALVGRRLRMQVVAERPGHQGNIRLAAAIARRAEADGDGPVLDVGRILEILPHRFPFLLVDRITEYERGERIVGLKNVTINEPFFVGHFPGMPIMPGVLIIEAMAQVGGLLLMDMVDEPENKVPLFMSLDRVKFRRPVTPGDQIEFELNLLKFRRGICRMRGVARVDGAVVAEAELMAQVVER